ncbi:unnamed protein product [Allacma fusca]|uniref:Dynein intermediate chain 3, ciliary n=1 Tax=Allacma fusca TaxID=39272 RepID=A0A8J2PFZ6_9HEXA|nr:unnamed protein product [Allacma fusca]
MPGSEGSVTMNTIRAIYQDAGLYHNEGGWPKDINLSEPEMVSRYRKKLEKDDQYQTSMLEMTSVMERLIKQNNALDIYGDFFGEPWKDPDTHKQPPYAHVIEVYRDFCATRRPVSRITWAPENAGRVGICHCPLEFDGKLRQQPTEAFLWDLENASRPESVCRAGTHIVDIRYNPKDINSIIGGCFDGSVCVWDSRLGPNAVETSPFDFSHGDICTGVMWINSKTGTEFFSTGLDGQVIWWDNRKLSEVIESTWLDPEKGQCRSDHALGASVLEYEHTLPTKFMAGTETGQVMIMMRKGKTPNDKLVHVYKAHHGPVRGLQRNPTFIKNFLTVGDQTCRIFAEDCRESSILWTAPKNSLYTHGAWIPTRASSFCCCRLDGNLDFWDMLMDPVRPHLVTRVCDDSLITVAPSDNGKFVAVGTDQGNMSLVRLAEAMTTSEKSDKPVLAAVFERESRREKVLEQRNREIRLRKRDKEKAETEKQKLEEARNKQREEAEALEKETGKKVPLPDLTGGKKFDIVYEIKTDPIIQGEREFFQTLRQEMETAGVHAFPDKKEVEKIDVPNENLTELPIDLDNVDLSGLLDDDDDAEEEKGAKDSKEKGFTKSDKAEEIVTIPSEQEEVEAPEDHPTAEAEPPQELTPHEKEQSPPAVEEEPGEPESQTPENKDTTEGPVPAPTEPPETGGTGE